MVASVGLLDNTKYDPGDNEAAYRLGIAAWYRWRESSVRARAGRQPLLLKLYGELAGAARHLVGERPIAEHLLKPNVPIRSVAVWDTVGSLGVPWYTKDQRIDVFRFADTDLSPHVANGFHAVAIDEQRTDFSVTRWSPRQGVREVWFSGAHSDVGGGVPDTGLSDIALDWMSRRLLSVDVRLEQSPPAAVDLRLAVQPMDEPWKKPPFSLLKQGPRAPQLADVFHPQVRQRWEAELDPLYRPACMKWPGFTQIEALTFDQ